MNFHIGTFIESINIKFPYIVNNPPIMPKIEITFDVFLVLSINNEIGKKIDTKGHKSNKKTLLSLNEYVYGSYFLKYSKSFFITKDKSFAYLIKIK